MPSHYLKLPNTLREWFPGGAPTDWRDVVLADVSENGKRLVIEFLPANDRGERLALHGDRFYYEVGRDRDRYDTMFVIRIESSERRLPRRTPISYQCQILLWPGGDPSLLSPVGPLFGLDVDHSATEKPDTSAKEVAPAEPSPLLLRLLQKAPEDVRVSFRPGSERSEAADAKAFLMPLQVLWRTSRFSGHVSASPRQERLLTGGVTPAELGRKERDGLLNLFGFDLLNRMLAQGLKPDDLYELVRRLGALPISSRVRSVVWSASLTGLDSEGIRRELAASAKALQQFVTKGTDAEGAWEEGLLGALREVGKRTGDVALVELVATAEAAHDPLATIAAWADQLAPASDADLGGVAPPVAMTQKAVAPTPALPLSANESWLLRSAFPSVEQLNEHLGTLGTLTQELFNYQETMQSLSAARRALELLETIAASVGQARIGLPDVKSLDDAAVEARNLLQRAEKLLGSGVPDLLSDPSTTPQALQEICDLVDREKKLRDLPSWLWGADFDDAGSLGSRTNLDVAKALANPERRRLISDVLGYVDELTVPNALQWLRAPDPDQSVETHVRRWFEGTRDFLAALSPAEREAIGSGGLTANPEDLVREQQVFQSILQELDPAVAAQVEAEIPQTSIGSQRSLLIAQYSNAVAFFRQEFGDARSATFAALKSRVTRQQRTEARPEPKTGFPIQIDHNSVESAGTRATLVFRQPDSNVAWGYFDVPIVLETEQPRDFQIRLEYDIKGEYRKGWPKEWPDPEPSSPFRIDLYSWRRDPDRRIYQVAKAVRLPVRVPSDESPRLEVTIRAVDPVSAHRLSLDAALRWDSIATKPVEPTLEWIGTTNPAYVRDHPIGPQLNANRLLDRLAGGSSVAVIAPRRFGKSTLVEYFESELRSRQCLLPQPSVCTLHMGPAGFDHVGFWNGISDELQKVLDVGLPRTGGAGLLPDVRAFDAVRRRAKSKGFAAVVILVDEAQLFFSGPEGKQLGTQLKNLLERDWSRVDQPTMAPLRMGLVGLPSLADRAGADLMGLLMPVTRSDLREDELRPLIAGMAKNLQTTRAARIKLAESAGNLFILRVLLERIIDRLKREGRIWCNYEDVQAVYENLEEDLTNRREEDLANYIRDALNDAEVITDWEPSPSFPVAAALAPVCHPSTKFDEAVTRATEQLNAWGRLSQPSDTQSVPTYDTDRVRQHVRQLEERGILHQGQFRSRLLQAWLVGVNQIGTFDEAFVTALFKGSQRRVRIPAAISPVASGLEARVYRVKNLAYRVKHLESASQRQRFLDSCQMLELLRGGHVGRESGSDYIFELQEMGLSADDSDEAVQVYHWIVGEDLGQKAGVLGADLVVDIGTKLARGVSLLHRYGILHRDIRPSNVIANLDDPDTPGIRPVLIDFGFARTVGADMSTRLAGDFAAPEVSERSPRWSKAADVYSLAATLAALLSGPKPSDLTAVLESALVTDPGARPSAEVMLSEMESIADKRRVDEKRQEHWSAVQRSIGPDRHKPWFTRVLNKHRTKFEALGLGFHNTPLDKYRLIAAFVDQVAEAFPPTGLRLRVLIDESEAGSAVRYLAALRVAEAHAGDRLLDEHRETLRAFQRLSPRDQQDTVVTAVKRVAGATKLESLVTLIELHL